MTRFAWIGVDAFGSGVIWPIDRYTIDTLSIRVQLQNQADRYGQTIRLAEFELVQDRVVAIEPAARATGMSKERS